MTVNNNLETKKLQLLQYLPEFYQEKGPGKEFLERFLSIFANIINNIDSTISAIPIYFDPITAPGDFIPWLAQWLSLDLYELLGEKNREFILKAVEFYKKKGTVSGIADLVTFLTGKKCCIKEYMNNLFRTWGMEHGTTQEGRSICKTVDTANPELLAKIGTYDDELHYTIDTGDSSLYSRDVIGLYIFLRREEKDFIIKEDQLHKIIDSFLPVFVRAEIIIVEENYETYEIAKIVDTRTDRGWQSNTIVPDYGRFLAALMKKDFCASVGIEYLAVGSGSQDNDVFRNKIIDYFQWLNEDETHTGPLIQENVWAWAKKIESANIKYLNDAGIMTQEITNRLEIEVKITRGEPANNTLSFEEFALLGIDKDQQGKFDTGRMFLVNYVSHGAITKDKDMELSRTIKLLFPLTN